MQSVPSRDEARRMSTEELRRSFLLDGLFIADQVALRHIDLDRVVLGGAVPASRPLEVHPPESIGANYLAERREVGILNIGGSGRVEVDGQAYVIQKGDAVYVGRGARSISLDSEIYGEPARFYIVSYPAHTSHPTTVLRRANIHATVIGSAETANRRSIARYVDPQTVASAQLVMGVTTLDAGSVWNTMPPHTHHRRTEVYLYFDLPREGLVLHLLGEPSETRHLVVRDGEAVIAPGWSVHCGCGTSSYSFCWAMGGENQVYNDMQPVELAVLR